MIRRASQLDLELELSRQRMINMIIDPRGKFKYEVENKFGKTYKRGEFHNGITTFGYNYMLDATFRNGTATMFPSWALGLIGPVSYSGLSVGDIPSSHTGWTEDYTHYTLSNRPSWSPGAASAKVIQNSSSVNFPINTDSTIIKGIFVISENTLNGTTGLLWSTGLFGSDQTLYNGDTLKITYIVTLN